MNVEDQVIDVNALDRLAMYWAQFLKQSIFIHLIFLDFYVAQNTARSGGSAIDGRTTRHMGYAKSINARRGIEKVFGWI